MSTACDVRLRAPCVRCANDGCLHTTCRAMYVAFTTRQTAHHALRTSCGLLGCACNALLTAHCVARAAHELLRTSYCARAARYYFMYATYSLRRTAYGALLTALHVRAVAHNLPHDVLCAEYGLLCAARLTRLHVHTLLRAGHDVLCASYGALLAARCLQLVTHCTLRTTHYLLPLCAAYYVRRDACNLSSTAQHAQRMHRCLQLTTHAFARAAHCFAATTGHTLLAPCCTVRTAGCRLPATHRLACLPTL